MFNAILDMSGYAAACKHGLAVLHRAILPVHILRADLVEGTSTLHFNCRRHSQPTAFALSNSSGCKSSIVEMPFGCLSSQYDCNAITFTLSCVVPMNLPRTHQNTPVDTPGTFPGKINEASSRTLSGELWKPATVQAARASSSLVASLPSLAIQS